MQIADPTCQRAYGLHMQRPRTQSPIPCHNLTPCFHEGTHCGFLAVGLHKRLRLNPLLNIKDGIIRAFSLDLHVPSRWAAWNINSLSIYF